MILDKTASPYYFRFLCQHIGHYAGASLETVSTTMHSHQDFYETILVLSGKFEHVCNNVSTQIPTGTLILLKPGSTHHLHTAAANSVHFVLCVEERYFRDFVKRTFPNYSLDTMDDAISTQISNSKMKYIEELGRLLSSKNTDKAQWMAEEIIFLYLSSFANQKNIFECNHYVSDIVAKIDNQLYMNSSVKDICSNYPYSQCLLLRQFKELTGYTIVEYKTKQKMKYACELLKKTDARILDIAELLHYESQSYFVHAFKKEIGLTPSEYRRLERVKLP